MDAQGEPGEIPGPSPSNDSSLLWKSAFINKQLLLYYIKRKGDQIHFQPLPKRGSVLFVEVCISFPDSLDFRQLAAL